MQSPDQIYGELFTAVQSAQIFSDSKTFVDCIPKSAPDKVLNAYREEKKKTDFSLKAFVAEHFKLPPAFSSDFTGDPARPIAEHIELLWDILRREGDKPVPGSSLISLPYPYIVPGGRFGEIYYWDSFFTMLGLLVSGRSAMAKHMLSNFAFLIDSVGHIPNGNRTYFQSRSQPPFFALMVHEVARHTKDTDLYALYTPQVLKEYLFWMAGAESIGGKPGAAQRVVIPEPGVVLNRYWDDSALPRQESYYEDVSLAEESGRSPEEIYRDVRAACESGWDFSARWFRDPDDLGTIRTTDIIPVDLNCLLWSIENFLALSYEGMGQDEMAKSFHRLKDRRKAHIHQYFWNRAAGVFSDYDHVNKKHTEVPSLAMLFPLYMQIADKKQAVSVAKHIKEFLKPGGLVTTLLHTGQQWDAPNGWAPLQWIGYQGLKNYGFDGPANEISKRWTANVTRVYQNTGKLLEKYNVEDVTLEAGGGEYPVQDGFGWTNGVMQKFLSR